MPSWIEILAPRQALPTPYSVKLGDGEKEAIALALELKPEHLIVDDDGARRFAVRHAIPVIGTAGVLGLAKVAGIIDELRPHLDALRASGFRLSDAIYNALLAQAGE